MGNLSSLIVGGGGGVLSLYQTLENTMYTNQPYLGNVDKLNMRTRTQDCIIHFLPLS